MEAALLQLTLASGRSVVGGDLDEKVRRFEWLGW
jgi:hypothetical protein